jgi:hypothetical protein
MPSSKLKLVTVIHPHGPSVCFLASITWIVTSIIFLRLIATFNNLVDQVKMVLRKNGRVFTRKL